MINEFFTDNPDRDLVLQRLRELDGAKVGFYSIGLYPASLAYNSAMQAAEPSLLLAPRPGRTLLGAFDKKVVEGMDAEHIEKLIGMSTHREANKVVNNTLADLLLRCDLVILSANSNHIEQDLIQAIELRNRLQRKNVLLACLSGSFDYDESTGNSYVLCEKESNLAFFSGFHRHEALRNPLDSFTANFCHPDALTALIGAKILDKISPNIQVSPGVHNLEAQYIKAAKNISSIFSGFAHCFHKSNTGLLPTILTLLLNQCLDQAASVSMFRKDRNQFYEAQLFSITELGYGVTTIEAKLGKSSNNFNIRDHTFSQLIAVVSDVYGSLTKPLIGSPTRNFQAGEILAKGMIAEKRCPLDEEEFVQWCEDYGQKRGGLEGLKSLKYWPRVMKQYSLAINDTSMNNLLYMTIFGPSESKEIIYNVLTNSRELTSYCQESIRPNHSKTYSDAFENLNCNSSKSLILELLGCKEGLDFTPEDQIIYSKLSTPYFAKALKLIDYYFNNL